MKSMLFMIILLYAAVSHGINGDEAVKYNDKYDDVDLDVILANERLLTGYIRCLLELGPCTPDGKELKNNLPDAIEHDCSQCTEKQRKGADKVMHHIIDHRPEDWSKLEQKYNVDGSYKKAYLETKTTDRSLEKVEKDNIEFDGHKN